MKQEKKYSGIEYFYYYFMLFVVIGRIGSSSNHKVLENGKWSTYFQLYCYKLSKIHPKQY